MIKRKNDEKEKQKTGLGMLRREVAFRLPILGIVTLGAVGLCMVAVCAVLGLFVVTSQTRTVSPPIADAVQVEAGMTPLIPTPTAHFNSSIGVSGYPLITTEQVGVIPANTRVRVSSAYLGMEGWIYTVVMVDEKTAADAKESQLAYAPGIEPGPTPTAQFGAASGYQLVTTTQIGPIPPNTRVQIVGMRLGIDGWIYTIMLPDGKTTTEATDAQLAYGPGVTPGVTPTARFGGSAGYQLMTTEPVSEIPANTRVQITSMRLGIDGWLYTIVAPDGKTFAEATDSQLAYVPGATPGATPMMTYAGEIGMGGYRMITTQQVGKIPTNTRVRISSARLGVDGWLYSIVGVDEQNFEDATDSQIAYAPGVIPGATPTAKFGN